MNQTNSDHLFGYHRRFQRDPAAGDPGRLSRSEILIDSTLACSGAMPIRQCEGDHLRWQGTNRPFRSRPGVFSIFRSPPPSPSPSPAPVSVPALEPTLPCRPLSMEEFLVEEDRCSQPRSSKCCGWLCW